MKAAARLSAAAVAFHIERSSSLKNTMMSAYLQTNHMIKTCSLLLCALALVATVSAEKVSEWLRPVASAVLTPSLRSSFRTSASPLVPRTTNFAKRNSNSALTNQARANILSVNYFTSQFAAFPDVLPTDSIEVAPGALLLPSVLV
jgi:hypothetical protein